MMFFHNYYFKQVRPAISAHSLFVIWANASLSLSSRVAPQSTSLRKDVTSEEVQEDKKDGGGVEVACARHGEGVLLPRLEEP